MINRKDCRPFFGTTFPYTNTTRVEEHPEPMSDFGVQSVDHPLKPTAWVVNRFSVLLRVWIRSGHKKANQAADTITDMNYFGLSVVSITDIRF